MQNETLKAKQALISMRMSEVVPRSAIGYVFDLTTINPSTSFIKDRLQQLQRYCPDLVQEFRLLILQSKGWRVEKEMTSEQVDDLLMFQSFLDGTL